MPRPRLLSVPKLAIALSASAVGVLLPWRARIWYSEGLGWLAQIVPPRFYTVKPEEGEHGRP
jgi:hypothetical protein